jgi:hypothetical protein
LKTEQKPSEEEKKFILLKINQSRQLNPIDKIG